MSYEDILEYTLDPWHSSDRHIKEEIEQHLEFIGDVSLDNEPYQFEDLRIYVRRQDGMIMWATDSGCSCPVPFENHKVKDLKESTLLTFEDTVLVQVLGDRSYYCRPLNEVRKDLGAAIERAKQAGAR